MFTDGLRTHSAALAQCTPLLIATPGSQVVIVSAVIPEAKRHGYGAGIRDGQGRRRPAGPGRGGAQLREHGVASTAMHPAAVPPRASCNTPTAWT